MVALDTNVLIYACDNADPSRQKLTLDLVSNSHDGVLPEANDCGNADYLQRQ